MKTYKWTEEQKKALRGSIRKWQRIVNGTGIDDGPDNCACCKKWIDLDCKGCPIAEFTGSVHCDLTPYDITGLDDDEDRKVSIAELHFLRAVYLAGGGK